MTVSLRGLLATPIRALVLIAALAAPSGAHAYTLKVLHNFCTQPNCQDGFGGGSTVFDLSGNLYGMTGEGANLAGAIFMLQPNADKSAWSYTILYNFCTLPDCADGYANGAQMIVDARGDLYGVSGVGAGGAKGTAFELMPNADRTAWTFKILHVFCKRGGLHCTDGYIATGLSYAGQAVGAPYDGFSPLYGTTVSGGIHRSGTVFELQPKPAKKTWNYRVLYRFCSQPDCIDGTNPSAPVTVDGAGNLFGTTLDGGSLNHGAVFELQQQAGAWSERVIHDFCSEPLCADGQYPVAPLALDAQGNLYGTGSNQAPKCVLRDNSCGVVFELTPDADQWTLTVLHAFCPPQSGCVDGKIPLAGVALDGAGNIFGTTIEGGATGNGEVFALNPSFQVVHDFCQTCAEGFTPEGRLTLDATGNIYGGTQTSDAPGRGGAIYELVP